ncbi:MAG: hypothetical protein EPO65_03415 [Dehalococcoidia bacterium]|nr:MAG: hypothetical protein EPO65_03415 [Dehalococcoidia bacterium]
MGAPTVTTKSTRLTTLQPAFYTHTGDLPGDLLALLHLPYTAWHLAYIVFGAALAPALNWSTLLGTLLAFFFGTGIAAHAFDEWNGRPLGTHMSDQALMTFAGIGIAGSGAVALTGAVVLSPWVLVWAGAGLLLMTGYTLEWHRWMHSDAAFGLTWGGFPVLVGYWAQTGDIDAAAVFVAGAATLLSLAQRSLSTHARAVRRKADDATVHFERPAGIDDWGREHLLSTWEQPLKLLAASVVTLAAGMLVTRI